MEDSAEIFKRHASIDPSRAHLSAPEVSWARIRR
jgi:hypothetical protein